ncbi:hypothetical protein Mapa_015563 [Marchantia paleacea]|nr:hypothetical protein Mapa_015563 [Marchantia paleacea]
MSYFQQPTQSLTPNRIAKLQSSEALVLGLLEVEVLIRTLGLVSRSLVDVPVGNSQKEDDVEPTENGEKPVEAVQVTAVDVVLQPAVVVARLGGRLGDAHEGRAEEAAHSEGSAQKGVAHGSDAGRGLVVEELQLPHNHEPVGQPDEEELRDEPERAEAQELSGLQVDVVGAVGVVSALLLDQGCAHHAQHAEDEPHSDPLEIGKALGVSRVAGEDGDEHEVVNRQEEDQRQHGHGGHARRRDVEAQTSDAHSFVHAYSLHDAEGSLLHQNGCHDHCARPHWNHSHQYLQLFHLVYCANPPGVVPPP